MLAEHAGAKAVADGTVDQIKDGFEFVLARWHRHGRSRSRTDGSG
jgi:hypothetical protein